MALLRLCTYCKAKVPFGTKCTCEIQHTKDKYNQYKHDRKDKQEQNFYSGRDWIRLRDMIRCKHNGMCVICYMKDKQITQQNVVHHIVELKENFDLRLDEENLICLCNNHHNQIHKLYDRDDETKAKTQQWLQDVKRLFEEKFTIN